MSLFKNINAVQYFVKDWEAAKKFYTEVLEWPVAYASDELGWYEFGVDHEAHIALTLWTEDGPPPTHGPIVLFSVDDTHAAAKALKAKGVKVTDVVDIPGVVSYATFYDPEGNQLQFAASNES